jgi:hypothetical protein
LDAQTIDRLLLDFLLEE